MGSLKLVIITVIITVIVSFFTFMTIISVKKKKNHIKVENVMKKFITERNKAESVLNELEQGVIAFAGDNSLISYNRAAKKMLNIEEIPKNHIDFFNKFGQDNGLKAAFLLGHAEVEGKLLIKQSILKIKAHKGALDNSQRNGTIIVIQDITLTEQEEERRKEFVANVSHELKTPLTTIKSYSESLLDWGLNEKKGEAIRRDIVRIQDDALRMEKMVSDLLLLSSIDSQGMKRQVEQIDFGWLIKQNIERIKAQAKDEGLEISCTILSKMPKIYGDRTGIERILVNLLTNALKYTDKGGKIKVYASRLVDDVYVKIKDNGIGITQENQKKIFDRFYRVDNTGSRRYGGTGLGLAIVKELVELNHGRIRVESQLGMGTEFTVLFPSVERVVQDCFKMIIRHEEETIDPIYRLAIDDIMETIKEMNINAQLNKVGSQTRDIIVKKVINKDINV